ncbi:MAG: hypothetical protein HYX51_00175 [Chloroflexi bacterium]|nr:hypothetical protein [Chloroflexota bacterium]
MRRNTGLVVLGVCIAILSAFFVAAAIGDLVTGDDPNTSTGVLLGLLVFFLGTGAGGVFLAVKNYRARPAGAPETDFEQEQRILALAQYRGGRLTIAEVAVSCQMSIAESKQRLDRMRGQGVAEIALMDDGVLVYTFSAFLPPGPG